jgi:hypothetical protein
VHSVTVSSPSLDEVFLHYTGHSFRDNGEDVNHAPR